MKATVIIAAYKRRDFLMDALRSVANQVKPRIRLLWSRISMIKRLTISSREIDG